MSIVPIRTEYLDIQPDDIISIFLTFKRATGISSGTIQQYEKALALFFSRHPDALDFPRERTMEFLSGYQNPYSYNLYFAYLKVFWDWTLREGYFGGDRHPLSGLKKRRTQGRIVQLSEREVARLLQQPAMDTYAGRRDYALLCLSIDTGIRPGEALQLVPLDFSHEKGEILIRRDVAKTRTPRVLPLSPTTADSILNLLTIRPASWTDAPIYCTETGTKLSVSTWSRRVSSYGRKAGIDITAYHLRHAAALLLLRHGADAFTVQRILGHSTMQMTRHYVNLTSEDIRKGHAKAGVLLSLVEEETLRNARVRKLPL